MTGTSLRAAPCLTSGGRTPGEWPADSQCSERVTCLWPCRQTEALPASGQEAPAQHFSGLCFCGSSLDTRASPGSGPGRDESGLGTGTTSVRGLRWAMGRLLRPTKSGL